MTLQNNILQPFFYFYVRILSLHRYVPTNGTLLCTYKHFKLNIYEIPHSIRYSWFCIEAQESP